MFVAELIQNGFLDVFRVEDMADRGNALDVDSALSVVSDQKNWAPPQQGTKDPLYCIKESHVGERERRSEFPNI
jgi:hypothetical protein